MANSIIGQIISIGQTQSLTSKSGTAFTKRDVVISVRRFDPNTGEPVNDYENTPLFSFMGDRCRDLDQFQVGQNVEIFFDLSGRRYTPEGGTEKIINDVRPYKIELYGRSAATATAQGQPNGQWNVPQVPQQPIGQGYGQQVQQGGYVPPMGGTATTPNQIQNPPRGGKDQLF